MARRELVGAHTVSDKVFLAQYQEGTKTFVVVTKGTKHKYLKDTKITLELAAAVAASVKK